VNKKKLPIEGDLNLHITTDGHKVTANVSVLPAIDELLLASN